LVVKLLRYEGTNIPMEAKIAEEVANAKIDGFVHCQFHDVKLTNASELSGFVNKSYSALIMPRFMSSLEDCPILTEVQLYSGFSRLLQGLKILHDDYHIVHMDLKSGNIFVSQDGRWRIGDFGCARKIGGVMNGCTDIFNPVEIPKGTTVIPSMDLVQLCFIIAFELKKADWKTALLGNRDGTYSGRVQPELIEKALLSITIDKFRKEVHDLFILELIKVKKHLSEEPTANCCVGVKP